MIQNNPNRDRGEGRMKRYELERFTEEDGWYRIESWDNFTACESALGAWSRAYPKRKYRLVEVVEVRTVLKESGQ